MLSSQQLYLESVSSSFSAVVVTWIFFCLRVVSFFQDPLNNLFMVKIPSCFDQFLFPICIIFGTFVFLNIFVTGLQLFSFSETVSHDIVVAVLSSYTSPPPGFFGGRFSTYSPLFVLSLLLKRFVLFSLLSWPFEAFAPPHFCFLHCC